ncbi:MAG: hypothetical protein EA379_07675 [Phycisphaerales bacterium]|nr:MAG: hypothetical protein EA379_07675 [Phycisphaerales bacterium]
MPEPTPHDPERSADAAANAGADVRAVMRAEAENEVEGDAGWTFDVTLYRLERPGVPEQRLASTILRLSWQDYERWCSGTLPPSSVAEQVVRCAAARLGVDAIPPTVDASTLHRRTPELDDDLAACL